MSRLASVYVVQHIHVHPDGEECVKMIGVYETESDAELAVGRLSTQPGFRDHPRVINPSEDGEESGFFVDVYTIGEDHWTEGYITES